MASRGKNLHIFAFNNIYCTFFQKFIEDNFDSAAHEFFYLQPKEKLSFFQKWSRWKSIKPSLHSTDKIFIHFLPTSSDLFFYFLNSYYLSKSYWSLWGRDVFYKDVKKSGLNKWVIETLRKSLIPKIGTIIGHPSDLQFLEQNYQVSSDFAFVFYPLPGLTFKEKVTFEQSKKTINILLGNSADPSNRHLITLDLLEKYKEEDLKIYCPISYGGPADYVKEVADYGKKLFGDKFIPLMDFMPIEEYKALLNKIDITVMNQERQQGLGNIRTLLFQGKKIYMARKNTPLEQYQKELKFNLFDVKDIDNEPFESFKSMPTSLKEDNSSLAKKHFGNKGIVEMWKPLF